MFNIVERSNNYAFRGYIPPTARWRRAISYEIWPLFAYSICYWEVYTQFSGEEKFCVWSGFPWKGFYVGREVFGGELSEGSFTLGGFDRIPIRNSFYWSYFLFATSNLHLEIFRGKFSAGFDFWGKISTKGGISGVIGKTIRIKVFSKWKCANENFPERIVRKKVMEGGSSYRGWNCPEVILGGGVVFYVGKTFQGGVCCERIKFFMESEPGLPALFEKGSEIKYKNIFFFNREQGATLKLKTNRNYSVYEEVFPLLNTLFFTVRFYC